MSRRLVLMGARTDFTSCHQQRAPQNGPSTSRVEAGVMMKTNASAEVKPILAVQRAGLPRLGVVA